MQKTDAGPIMVLIIVAFAIIVILGILSSHIALSQTVTNSFPLAVERVDYVASDGLPVYSTKAIPRGGFVLVFRNGLLQKMGARPNGDYTSAPGPSSQRITFNELNVPPTLPAGDSVTLIYFR